MEMKLLIEKVKLVNAPFERTMEIIKGYVESNLDNNKINYLIREVMDS